MNKLHIQQLAKVGRPFVVAALAFVLTPGITHAQQLEPRAYSPAPVGLNIFGVASGYSSGGVVTDSAAPIANIEAEVTNVVPFYVRTFGLFGRLANVSVAIPYAWGTVSGDVGETRRSVDRSGLADTQLRFAVNLIGGPALTPQEFSRREPQMTLGASLTVVTPTGQYDSTHLINLGTNRWALKSELGLSQPAGKWIFELYAGIWFFETNHDYFGAQVRQQDPLASYQTHVVYTFRQNLWLAADYTYYSGGSTALSGRSLNDRQDNSRMGLTMSIPVTRAQSLKVAWATGVSTRLGSSFDTVGVTWQTLWR
jgi:hypothetical protein